MSNTNTVEWKTSKGATVKFVIALVLSKVNYCDGANVTVPECEIEISCNIEGYGFLAGGFSSKNPNTPLGGSVYGTKLAIVKENYDRINAVIDELKSAPEWIAKQERIAKSNEVEKDYQAHCNMMRKAMAE